MIVWMLLTAMCSAAAVLVAIPLIRRYENASGSDASGAGVYADQLREIARDREAGTIAAAEADIATIEIQRRLLAAVKPVEVSPWWRNVALAAAAGLVVAGAAGIYAVNGRPDLPAASGPRQAAPQGAAAGDVDSLIGKLAARLAVSPGDAEGWRMLGWSYFNTRRYAESAEAYGRALALAPGNDGYRSAHAEALVQAAQGIVTPAARSHFEKVLARDPSEQRSRFYLALAAEQAGDLGGAFDRWAALLADAPADAGWLADGRERLAELGKKTGRDTSALLASAPILPAEGGAPAIGQPDVAALAALLADDRQAMIRGMVDSLSERLAAAPHDAEGWLRLIRSRVVLKQADLAQEALGKAMAEFSGDAEARSRIAAAARELGVLAE